MKKFNLVLGMAMILIFGVTGLSAQFVHSAVRATVPFAFSVSGTTFSAGNYVISTLNDKVIQITNEEDKKTTIVLTDTVGGGNPVDPKLVFRQYEGRYFLAQVYLSYSSTGRGLAKSSEEARLQQSQLTPQVTIIAGK